MNQPVNQPVNPPAKPDARIHRGPDTGDVWPLIGIMFLHIAIWTGIIIMLALLANTAHAGEDFEADIVIPISRFCNTSSAVMSSGYRRQGANGISTQSKRHRSSVKTARTGKTRI